ncbi:MAG: TetR/AcrR family transcriptional regulator [Clostridiales bacterium]|nr:TetR/AcrR family transcriptional regulator [Clostridiales bacterium]
MPKFSEQGKERIQQSLLQEGERLFTTYGLKKVTIDEIVKAVKIAKASFYRFYEGKEYLFLDIAQRKQKEIFEILEGVLEDSKNKPDSDRVKLVFFSMSELMGKYPLLTNIDDETIELVARKVSSERLEEFAAQGFDAVQTMEKHGIQFRCDTQIVSQLFHALYRAWVGLQEQPKNIQEQVINIMLDGVINQIT